MPWSAASGQGVTGSDAEQPGPQRTIVAQVGSSSPGGDQGVHHDLLRVGVVADDQEGDPGQLTAVGVEQLTDDVGSLSAQVGREPGSQCSPPRSIRRQIDARLSGVGWVGFSRWVMRQRSPSLPSCGFPVRTVSPQGWRC